MMQLGGHELVAPEVAAAGYFVAHTHVTENPPRTLDRRFGYPCRPSDRGHRSSDVSSGCGVGESCVGSRDRDHRFNADAVLFDRSPADVGVGYHMANLS
ncbi:hypothetical protein [Rhodococcus koreensis]|uniref:hypothetical protein n=1 Tax=Rhodococcus koreensis TaxID=99653 RepID=UPI00115F8AD4|nr:hypothetical protein [Rhodococcus koreensis]